MHNTAQHGMRNAAQHSTARTAQHSSMTTAWAVLPTRCCCRNPRGSQAGGSKPHHLPSNLSLPLLLPASSFPPPPLQLLRFDQGSSGGGSGGLVERFLLDAAARSVYFAHMLVCQLLSEGTPPDEAFNPAVGGGGGSRGPALGAHSKGTHP